MFSNDICSNRRQLQSEPELLYYLRKYIELIHYLRYLLNLSHIRIWKKNPFHLTKFWEKQNKVQHTHTGFSRQQSKAAKDTQIFKIRDILRIKMSTPRVLDIASLS